MRITQIEFTETELLTTPAVSTRVRIWTRLDGDRIVVLHSMVNRPDGSVVYESHWSADRPEDFRSRDWSSCEEETGPPPEPQLNTLDQLLADILGPRARPAAAKRVADAWEIPRGLDVLRINEGGPAYTDREVTTYNDKGRLVGRITGTSLKPAERLPGWTPHWAACKSPG